MRVALLIVAAGCSVLNAGLSSSRASGQTPATTCPTVNDANGQPIPEPGCVAGRAASPAKRFPYPGENAPAAEAPALSTPDAPEPAATVPGAVGTQPGSSASGSPGNGAPQTGVAGRRFPYPGEAPATDAPDSNRDALRDAGSSGESSSSSSSSSGSAPAKGESSSTSGSATPADPGAGSPFTDPDPDTTPAPKRARKKLPPVPRQSPSEREEEDVRIAGFYQNDGNYKAAYGRAQDAVSLANDDPEAHLALAEAARKLSKFDEAQQNYRRCLELDPVPKTRRVAERALKEMSGGS